MKNDCKTCEFFWSERMIPPPIFLKSKKNFFFDHYDILKYDNRDPKRLNKQIILLFYSCLDGEC